MRGKADQSRSGYSQAVVPLTAMAGGQWRVLADHFLVYAPFRFADAVSDSIAEGGEDVRKIVLPALLGS